MKVAWVTHHLEGEGGPGWLPGLHRGGGEMTDAALRDAAPSGVQLEVLSPQRAREADGYDRVVVTGTDLLTDTDMVRLSLLRPLVFLHHRQKPSQARGMLLAAADPLVVHTPAHEAVERLWCEPRRVEHVLSPMGDVFRTGPKRDVALWAARDHPSKGRLVAEAYATSKGWPFKALFDAPRADVLDAMAEARWFIHLPLWFESEARSVIEAVLSGCEVVANRNVGLTSCERWRDRQWLTEQTSTAAQRFWGLVCGSTF